MNRTSKMLLEVACLTAITIVMSIIGLYVPQLAFFTIFLSAVTITILTVKIDEKVAILSVLVSYVLLILLTGHVITATTTILSFSFAGLTIGYGLKRRWDFREIFLSSSSAYLLSILIIIVLMNTVQGINVINEFIVKPSNDFFIEMEKSMEEALQIAGENPLLSEDMSTIKEQFDVEVLSNTMQYMIPSFFIVMSALLGYLTLALSKNILNKLKYDYKYLPNFAELKIAKETVVIFVVSFMLLLFIDQMTIRAALININFILAVVLMFCGLATVEFFIKKAGIPVIIRVIIYCVAFGMMTFLAMLLPIFHPVNMLIIVAVSDNIFDFRKLTNIGEDHG